jgi:2-dehydropantoate 2-reductase
MPSGVTSSEQKSVAIVGLGSVGGVVAGALSAVDRYEIIACSGVPSRG